jgi:hypothetical protein
MDDIRRMFSPEADYGVMWRNGADWPLWRVSYIADTGDVYAVKMAAPGQDTVRLLGVVPPDPVYSDRETYYRTLDGILTGWADPRVSAMDLGWVATRLALWQATSCFPPGGGKPRVLAAQCATCIGKPGNVMHLRPGRLRSMVAEALQQGCQGIICHATLPYGDHQDFGPALCRWFYDTFGARSNFVRVIERIGGFTEVDPPGTSEEQP